jgi:hypothetical protein
MNPRLLRPKASGFNPKSIAGLSLWLDASDASTLRQNSDGSVAATAHGDPVGYWGDKSGNNCQLIQATAGLRGQVFTSSGRTRVDIPATLNAGFSSATSPTTSSSATVIQAARFQGGFGNWLTILRGDGSAFFDAASSGVAISPSLTAGSPSYFAQGLPVTATRAALYSALNEANAVFSVTGINLSSWSGGWRYYNFGSSFQFTGEVGEVLVYNRTLTTAERTSIERYLAAKWGITLAPQVSNADAQDWVNRVYAAGSTVSQPVANAVSAFVAGCQADGIWDAMKSVVLLAGADTLAGALVPLKGTAPTNNNFVAGDYTRTTGLLGNVTNKFLDTNRAGNADPQNSFHAAVFASTVASGGVRVYSGAGLNASGSFNFFVDGGTAITFRNRTAGSSSFAGGASATGLIGTSRASSASYVSRAGGTSQTNTVTSETPVSQNIFMYALNNSGASFHANARLAFYSIGESIDLALLDTRVSALVTAIGAT